MSSSMIMMLWHLREMSKVRQIRRDVCRDMMECTCRPTGMQVVWNSVTRDTAAGLQRAYGSSDADGISQALHPPELSLLMALARGGLAPL